MLGLLRVGGLRFEGVEGRLVVGFSCCIRVGAFHAFLFLASRIFCVLGVRGRILHRCLRAGATGLVVEADDAVELVAVDEQAIGGVRRRLCDVLVLVGQGHHQFIHEHGGLEVLTVVVHPTAAQTVVKLLALPLEAVELGRALAFAGRLAHGHVHLARDEAHRPRHAFHHGVRVVAGRLGAPAHDEGQVAQNHDEAGAQDARCVGQDAVGLQRAVDHAADEGRAAVDGAGLEGDGRPVHEHVAGDAPADGGDGAEHYRGDDGKARREALRRADDGPQGYRDVVQEVDDGVQVGGQLAEVEHCHAGKGAGQEKPRALEGVQAVVLEQDVADDAAAHAGDAGDGHGAEDVVAGAHGGHAAGQAAGHGSGELEPEGEVEGGLEGHEHSYRFRTSGTSSPAAASSTATTRATTGSP